MQTQCESLAIPDLFPGWVISGLRLDGTRELYLKEYMPEQDSSPACREELEIMDSCKRYSFQRSCGCNWLEFRTRSADLSQAYGSDLNDKHTN